MLKIPIEICEACGLEYVECPQAKTKKKKNIRVELVACVLNCEHHAQGWFGKDIQCRFKEEEKQ